MPLRTLPPDTVPTFGRPRRSRTRKVLTAALAVVLAGGALGTAAVATNAFGAGEKWQNLVKRVDLLLNPPPDRPIAEEPVITPEPEPTDTPTPEPTATPSQASGETPAPTPSPTPEPRRVKVDVDILKERGTAPDSVFQSEQTVEWCAPAAVQITLATLGLADTRPAFQNELVSRIGEWESWRDSHNGDWGPHAMRLALEAYGADGYVVKAYVSRHDALRDAARAIKATGAPVILLAWKGAHAWVMTGYRADADPSIFRNAQVRGAYILDPWYPRNSTIWGQSDGPGVFQDSAEMERNFLPWHRPEGQYPGRDDNFIIVMPTRSVGNAKPLTQS
jgi:hypothetical protein